MTSLLSRCFLFAIAILVNGSLFADLKKISDDEKSKVKEKVDALIKKLQNIIKRKTH